MTIQDDPVMALRTQLHQLPCPNCGTHELVPMLQCDYYPDGCLWLVRCKTCQAQYHLDHRSVSTWVEDTRTVVTGGRSVSPRPMTEQKGGSHANP